MTEKLPIITESHDGYMPVVKHDSVLQPLELENIADLQNAEVAPFDLMSDYWSPEMKGESRRVLFDRIQTMSTVDQASGEVIELECAFFFYQETPGGPIKQIRNGSKRLVGGIQGFNIPRLTPLLIKYLGKVKNKNNANQSDNWSITPLRVNVTSK
jgi:hypothetical protein